MKKRGSVDKIDTSRWLTTYADLMNNLLVLFMALYAMSIIDLNKYKALMHSFSQAFGGGSGTSSSNGEVTGEVTDVSDIEFTTTAPDDTETEPPDDGVQDFDELYDKINNILVERGYNEMITVEKVDGYIYFRFLEGLFFYPDQPILKENSYPAVETIGEILNESYDLIDTIEISGHTAKTTDGPQSTTDFFSWELSSGRALTVLKFLVQKCGLPQSKMSITGFSCNRPFVVGNSEEYWAQNRRVEIRISKVED